MSTSLLPYPTGPERTRLRRLGGHLLDIISPHEPYGVPGLLGAYRAATAPAVLLPLLDHVDELEGGLRQRLREWRDGCTGQVSGPELLDQLCRALTGRGLDEEEPAGRLPA